MKIKLAPRLVPFQMQFVRPLADAAEQREWVPPPLARGLRRIDGTCRIDQRHSGSSAGGCPTIKVRHPIVSRLYAGQVKKAEELGLAERRRQLLASLSGRVVEIPAGTGANS